MITVTKEYRTETAHRLRNYDGKCKHLHGHSYRWVVTAEADSTKTDADGLDARGLAVDFKDLKAAMVTVLEPLDHALLLRMDDPLPEVLTEAEKQRLIRFPFNPTAEELARWAGHCLEALLPGHVFVVSVTVWETETSFATWRNVAPFTN